MRTGGSPTSEIFVGWGTLALINAGRAQRKNRSGLAWFLAGVFLGPLATPILVLPDQQSVQPT